MRKCSKRTRAGSLTLAGERVATLDALRRFESVLNLNFTLRDGRA
jgi:hypothetical protein